jgi:hypothetical protein
MIMESPFMDCMILIAKQTHLKLVVKRCHLFKELQIATPSLIKLPFLSLKVLHKELANL